MISSFGLLQAQVDVKSIKKNSAQLSENLFISKYEVTNKDYAEFRAFIIANGNKKLQDVTQVDTLNWIKKNFYHKPYVAHYYQHTAYQDYPVVNINYQATQLFCQWLTDQYNENEKRKFNKVKFRLPTKEEWIKAVQAGNSDNTYPWDGNDEFRKNGACRANYKRKPETLTDETNTSNYDVTASVASYWPNKLGIYNLSGNVAEMLDNQAGTVGGSFLNTFEFLSINSPDPFQSITDKPDSSHVAIGFRWVMEVIEE